MADAIGPGELLIDSVPAECGTNPIDAPAFRKAPGGAPVDVALSRAATDAATAARAELWHDRREPMAIALGCGYLTRTSACDAVARPEPDLQRGSRR
jgi:hypothetical protein